jgi:hypothetical protein
MGRELPKRRICATSSGVAMMDFAVLSPTRQETIASGFHFALTGISR